MEHVLAAVPHVRLVAAEDVILLALATWEGLLASARAAVAAFHKARPDLIGLTPLRLVGALEPRLPPRVAEAVIAALIDGAVLMSQGGAIRLPEHRLDLAGQDQQIWERIAPLLDGEARFRPPRVVDMAQALRLREGEVRRLLKAMARQREVVEIVPDHFFLRETMEEIANIVGELGRASADGYFPAAQLRDRLDNGRKVAIQLLDYFDRQGVTLRHGDLRCVDARRLRLFLGTAGALAA
jgi:selenocysteine-specific elongation factor